MARITVEDCIDVVNNQYDLVILAKERAVQLGRGAAPAVDADNDKKPVIALREIAEKKIIEEDLRESIVDKLRLIPDYVEEEIDTDETSNDTFRQMYQGGLSKSEMEKPASRKFTARITKPEIKVDLTEEVAMEEVATEEVATEEVAMEEVATEEVAMEEVATEEVAMEEVATEEVAMEEVATEEVAMEEVEIAEDAEIDSSANENQEEI